MKIIEVSSALILKNGQILVTQRGYGDFKNKWEFPGGKLENNETGEECIVREIKEELDTDINVVKLLNTIEYSYPTFHLIMHNYICELKNNHISLLEHQAAKFIDIDDLDEIDFLPADLLILEDLIKYLS